MISRIIYKATCAENGKIYIGQTIGKLRIRKQNHLSGAFNPKSNTYNTHFSRAIRKYGKNSWIWEIIYHNIPVEYLDIMEVWAIANYDSFGNGYNSTLGGDSGRKGIKHTEEAKRKMSKAQKGEKNPMYGKVHSKKTKQKMSKIKIGKKLTKEFKIKMSEVQMGRKNHMYGKVHSKKTKQKMSIAQKGEKNPRAKLTWEKVREIRKKYMTGKYTQVTLAKEYNINKTTVCRIIYNKIWIEENQDKGNKN